MALPQSILDHCQNHIEMHLRSCLTCMKFRAVPGGETVRCDVKPRVSVPAVLFDDEHAEKTISRAKRCKEWEGEDEQ
jgi:hypothetical protein